MEWPAGLAPHLMKGFGPIGPIFDPSMIVAFGAGIVIASNQMHIRLPFYGVLCDVTSDHVGDWKVLPLDSAHAKRGATPVTLQFLRARKFRASLHDFLTTLLVLTKLADGSYAWFPFSSVNPMNLVSYTRREDPLVCDTSTCQAEFDALDLPNPIPHGNESQPFMPEDGYVLRKGFEELSARREMVDPVEFQSASEASEGEAASEVGDIIGSIPAGYDRVNFTSDDRAFRDNGKLYTVDEVVWSEDSLRLFFCASGNLYAAGIFDIPELIEVMSLRGSDAVLCCFKEATRIAWVSSTVLRGELQKLQMFRSFASKRKRTDSALWKAFNQAMERARGYRNLIDDFVRGHERAASPLAWTAREEEEYTGIPVSAEESELRKVGNLITEAEAILKERATNDVMTEHDCEGMLAQRDLERVDQIIEKRFKELLKTDPDYVALLKKRRALHAKQGRRASKKNGQETWDPALDK